MSQPDVPQDAMTFERISAYVDGELPAAEMAEITSRARKDPALAAEINRIAALNEDLKAAFQIPDDAGLDLSAFETAARPPVGRLYAPMLLAACVGAAIIGLGAWSLSTDRQQQHLALGDLPLDSVATRLLETGVYGDQRRDGDVVVELRGSFFDADGRACREVDLEGDNATQREFGVACRDLSGVWRIEFAATEALTPPPASDAQIQPAQGPGRDAFDRFLESMGAGPELSPNEEAVMIDGFMR